MKTLKPTELASIDDLHEYSIRIAERAMLKKGKVPFRWLVRAQDRLAAFDTPWENDDDKDLHADFIRFILGATGATAYSFMTEAWIAQYKDGDGPALRPFVAPSKHPDREDVLMVSTYDRSGGLRVTRYGIRYSDRTRPGYGRLLARDDWRDVDSEAFEGRMFNLLRDLPATLDEYVPMGILQSTKHFGIMLRTFEKVRGEMIKAKGDFVAAARNVINKADPPPPPLPEVIIMPPYVPKEDTGK